MPEGVRGQINHNIMQIKGMDNQTYNVTGQAQGNFNTVGSALGIASFLGLNGGNLLGGGWNNGGCCSDNTMVNRYELNMTREADSLKSENALLRSQVYTDQKLVDVVKDYTAQINNLAAEVRANKDAQTAINLQQATLNATQTATISCMSQQIAQLQSLSQLVVPSRNVCDTCCGCCNA